jgi:hypothetical protein
MHPATHRGGFEDRDMKRMHAVDVLLVALALAFVALASPASAAAPCVDLGEYYTFAQRCAIDRGAAGDWLPLLLLNAALVGGTLALVSLRRHVLRMGLATGRARR